MRKVDPGNTRRGMLVNGVRLLGSVAILASAGRGGPARAAKMAKDDFHYQDRPKDGKTCASCRLFTSLEASKGVCEIVEGEVSPSGWCMAYSPKGG